MTPSLMGLAADRPAAGTVATGTRYFETDTLREYRSDGVNTWTQVSGLSGVELGYAQITANFTSGTTANTFYDVPGLSIAPTVGDRPILVECYLPSIYAQAATADVTTVLYEDGAIIQASTLTSSNTTNKTVIGNAKCRRSPSAGAHTYKVSVKMNLAGGVILSANAAYPAFIQAVEI